MKRAIFGLAVATMLFVGAERAGAGFINDLIHAEYRYPNMDTILQDLGTRVVNPVANFDIFGNNNLAVSDANIRITNSRPNDITWLIAPFNGVSITDITPGAENILSITIDPETNLDGFDLSRVFFSDHQVFINMQGFVTHADTVVSLDVQFAGPAIPEPSTLTLFGIGTLGLIGYGWRRRKRAAAS